MSSSIAVRRGLSPPTMLEDRAMETVNYQRAPSNDCEIILSPHSLLSFNPNEKSSQVDSTTEAYLATSSIDVIVADFAENYESNTGLSLPTPWLRAKDKYDAAIESQLMTTVHHHEMFSQEGTVTPKLDATLSPFFLTRMVTSANLLSTRSQQQQLNQYNGVTQSLLSNTDENDLTLSSINDLKNSTCSKKRPLDIFSGDIQDTVARKTTPPMSPDLRLDRSNDLLWASGNWDWHIMWPRREPPRQEHFHEFVKVTRNAVSKSPKVSWPDSNFQFLPPTSPQMATSQNMLMY